MNEEETYVAKVVYLLIDEAGQTSILEEAKLQDWYGVVEDNTHQIIRFTPFSPEAQAISGEGGRIEYMVAESDARKDYESVPEFEVESEVVWSISWERV